MSSMEQPEAEIVRTDNSSMEEPMTPPSSSEVIATEEEYKSIVQELLVDEDPIVVQSTIEMLHEDKGIAYLLSFITQLTGADANGDNMLLGPHNGAFPSIGDPEPMSETRDMENVTDSLQKSYRATMLLSNDNAARSLMPYLSRKAQLMTRCIFTIFLRNSRGNLAHGCRVIDHLLRYYIDDVYDTIGRSVHTVNRFLEPMLAWIAYAPVAEVFITLFCRPHNAAMLRFYASSPPRKWTFFRSASEWKLLLVLSNHVTNRKYSEAHCVAAADVFMELLDGLAADENGELLLQPAAHCQQLLDNLVEMAVGYFGSDRTVGKRTAAMKCIHRLLQKSTLEKVQGPPTSPYQSFGATIVNLVPNQLIQLRDQIFKRMDGHMPMLLEYVVTSYDHQRRIEMDVSDEDKPLPESAVRYSGYVVKMPFTDFRLTLIDALVEMVAHNPSRLNQHFTLVVWRVLVYWFFEYAHNNLYHAAFYQLFFIALRTDNRQALEMLVKKLKLVTLLIEHYRVDKPGTSNRGYILQCCNAIRLQAAAQPPDAFLRNFLQSHTTWRSFEPELRAETNLLCVAGLGLAVPQQSRSGMYEDDSWRTPGGDDEGIDLGSEYAKSLGFVDDVAWPDDGASEGSKKKKKRKGKKKSGNGAKDESKEEEELTVSGEESEASTTDGKESSEEMPNGDASGKSKKNRSKKKKGGKKK